VRSGNSKKTDVVRKGHHATVNGAYLFIHDGAPEPSGCVSGAIREYYLIIKPLAIIIKA